MPVLSILTFCCVSSVDYLAAVARRESGVIYISSEL
jgi:hypothetical protein